MVEKVTCINNKEVEGQLKVGLEYPVAAETVEYYRIRLGNGVKGLYRKDRFKEV
jgi:hypothetical protein